MSSSSNRPSTSSDPIKAALEAAESATIKRWDELCAAATGKDIRLELQAAAIAAFLRELPDNGFRVTVRMDGGNLLDLDCEVPDKDLIAAAVEAAAREGPDAD